MADVIQKHYLLHGHKRDVFGYAGYQGANKRNEPVDADLD